MSEILKLSHQNSEKLKNPNGRKIRNYGPEFLSHNISSLITYEILAETSIQNLMYPLLTLECWKIENPLDSDKKITTRKHPKLTRNWDRNSEPMCQGQILFLVILITGGSNGWSHACDIFYHRCLFRVLLPHQPHVGRRSHELRGRSRS